jgi:hypothetical protein
MVIPVDGTELTVVDAFVLSQVSVSVVQLNTGLVMF